MTEASEIGALPTGVVTFLFTDVEGSTALWAADSTAMAASLAMHDEILRVVVAEQGGYVFTTAGDSFAVAFQAASAGVTAATTAQARLNEATWPGPALRVRMGLHLGETVERGGDYFGPVVNLTARLESAGHGGQVLVTDAVRSVTEVDTVDLGSHNLRDVPDSVTIYQVGGGEFAELRIVGSIRTNLPISPGRLIGRERELTAVRKSLDSARLVTLTAAGGTGKTRLSLAVGEALLNHQPGGVWFVDLSPIDRDEDVPTTVAGVLGLQMNGNEPADRQVVDYLSRIDALLILDNCEHLVDACADLLEAFVRAPGKSRVLATTREFFDIDGEQAIRLSALDASGADSPAVNLFVERALAADSSMTFDNYERQTIAELCGHLDGSPLAIELASSRCGVMSPTELLDAIGERFELLRGGRRRRSRQTLEDTLDWSYDLLDDDEQRVFRSLGVFSGSFDRDAVASVTGLRVGAAVDLLESLTSKSLVLSERAGAATRFRLLETPAAYAERLLEEHGETDDVRNRHLDHYLAITDRFVQGATPTTDSRVFAVDRSNLLAAIEWAQAQGRWQHSVRLMFATYEAIATNADVIFRIARRTYQHADQIPEPDSGRAAGCVLAAAIQLDDFDTATEIVMVNHSSQDPVRRIMAVGMIAFNTMAHGDPAAAITQLDEAHDLLAEIAEPVARLHGALWIEISEAWSYSQLGDFATCRARCQNVRDLDNRLDHSSSSASQALYADAFASAHIGDSGRAFALADELELMESVYATAAEVRLVAHLVRGDRENALPLLKAHALDAATRRLSRAANNSMLFLALDAMSDDPTLAAKRLIVVEQARNPTTIATSIDLARRLGVQEDFKAARDRGIADRIASGRRAVDALAAEISALGWA